MISAIRTAFRTWTPWEEALTSAVLSKLGPKTQSILRTQLAAVNKVQRILGWREIDLYVKKKGRVDRSGLPTLFDDREFVLAKTVTKVDGERFYTTVTCVGGYLFSFESDTEVRRFAFRDDCEIEVLEFDSRYA